ncbi:MAG: flagellar motor switch protein FliG [candidate division Zixibacteria bacterium]|nr:flagellar motor switch protein FliG [candidate division Zixibacteria bacterium]
MSNESLADFSAIQKAAIALISFGSEVSALVLKGMSDADVERLTVEIANMKDVSPDLQEQIVGECHDIFIAREYVSQGGVDFAREILQKAVGDQRASEILNRLESSFQTSGFNLLKSIDTKQLVGIIQNEHPQTIAVILTQLTPNQAASILSDLPSELQSEVSLRIATMEKISPDILKEIEITLSTHFEDSAANDITLSGGSKTMAEILNTIDTAAEKNILQSLEAENAELAAEIKNMMFVFDDLILLDDRSIQRLLKEVESRDLAVALKAASEEVRAKIYSNVSERVAVMIKEEMEFMGPMRLSDVETAQQQVVEAVRRLEEEGQIVVAGRGGGKDDVIV